MLINQNGRLVNASDLNRYDTIIFYGASTRNAAVIDKLGIRDRVRYVVDSDVKREGENIDGFKIYSPAILEKEKEALILTVLEKYAEEITEKIKQYVNCELVFFVPGECNLELIKERNKNVLECLTYKKYIHMFPDEKFLYPYYTMLEERFNIDEHLFIVDYARVDLPENQYQNLEYSYEKNAEHNNIFLIKDFGHLNNIINREDAYHNVLMLEKLYIVFEKAEKIILHSVAFSKNFLKYIQSLIRKDYGKRMVWVCWGGDLYFERDSFVATEILQKIKCVFAARPRVEKIKCICDIKIIVLGSTAAYSYIPIAKKVTVESKGECLNILLGHFASELNNLEFGLEILYKFRNENIKIYCTLSYGVDNYREKIIRKGKEMFGDKFIPIIKYMPLKEYHAFLDTMDIVVYPMIRLAGVTTITYLSLIGKKIYMKKEMALKLLDFDIDVEDITKITEQGWENFASCSTIALKEKELQKLNNRVATLWREILDY